MATFQSLPLEIQQNIWDLTCLPEPGVCRPDPKIPVSAIAGPLLDYWWHWDTFKLTVPKRKYPAAAHVCRVSRECVLSIQRREQNRATRHGLEPLQYYIGQENRPADPDLDTFFIEPRGLTVSELIPLGSHMLNTLKAGSLLDIKHLAFSTDCLHPDFVVEFAWGKWPDNGHWLGRLKNLERISIVPSDDDDETDETQPTNRHPARELLKCEELPAKPDIEAYRIAENKLVETLRLNSPSTNTEGMDSNQTRICNFLHDTRKIDHPHTCCIFHQLRPRICAAQMSTTATLRQLE